MSAANGAPGASASGSPGGGGREDKIAAIGVRVRHWVAFHGIAVNLDPDLSHFQGIVPCGIASGPESLFGVTSLHDLGILVSMAELDMALKGAFAEVFGGLPADQDRIRGPVEKRRGHPGSPGNVPSLSLDSATDYSG